MPLITAHASEPSASRSTSSVKGSVMVGLVRHRLGVVSRRRRAYVVVTARECGGPGKALRPSLTARVFSEMTAASLRSLPFASLRSLSRDGGFPAGGPARRLRRVGPAGAAIWEGRVSSWV